MINKKTKELIVLMMVSIALALIAVIAEKAFAQTPQEACEIKGGIWAKTYCAPPDMKDEEITYAQRYTILKEIEMREVKDAIVQMENR